jgi:hypothetical protein
LGACSFTRDFTRDFTRAPLRVIFYGDSVKTSGTKKKLAFVGLLPLTTSCIEKSIFCVEKKLHFKPGANPTIVRDNAGAVKINNAAK